MRSTLTCLLLILSALQSAHAIECSAVKGGAPCSADDIASVGGTGGPNVGAGNPINVITGNKYQREEDLSALPGVLGLEIVRHYNSAYSRPGTWVGPAGRGWRLSYETSISHNGEMIQILQADGGRVIFNQDPKNPGLCTTPNPTNGKVEVDGKSSNGSTYIWTWTNGRKLHFNRGGKLTRIVAPTGEAVKLTYDRTNVLVKVTDPQQRTLTLVYSGKKTGDSSQPLRSIDSPAGKFEYEYGGAIFKRDDPGEKKELLPNLVRVRFPQEANQKTSRLYHHENLQMPWLLTGMSDESWEVGGRPAATRITTYGYDAEGRAIRSMRAGGVGKITLEALDGNKTILTNSHGQKTTYSYATIAGMYRLLEVRGAGCSSCGETNVRYAYNRAGQLTETTKLTENGEAAVTITTDYDVYGRPAQVRKFIYAKGKAGPAELVVRYEYKGDRFLPSVLARPSVVPGMEVVTRVDYNAAGQILSLKESGWVPALDGVHVAGRMERTTAYSYTDINGWSLLSRIDGPLPNGKANSPIDSDVTILEYDNRSNSQPEAAKATSLSSYERREGLLTRITEPGNFATDVLERDEAKRPLKIRFTDGYATQLTTIRNNWRGAPVNVGVTAGALRRETNIEYNFAGQITAVTHPGKLRTAYQYDAAGQLTKAIMPDGSGLSMAVDTESRVERTARFLDAKSGIHLALPNVKFHYDRQVDKPAKLSHLSDAIGSLKQFHYGDLGQLLMVTNALGTSRQLERNAQGLITARTDAVDSNDAATIRMEYDNHGNATAIMAPNDVLTVRRYDDFGRKVLEADPDHGATLFRHDAGDRLIARIDETRATTRFAYDHADRLTAIGIDKQPNLTQYQYRGRQLSRVLSTTASNPARATERIDYERDPFGQITMETRWIASVSGDAAATERGLTFVTKNAFDDAGRLVKQTLPDGHGLEYRYAAADMGSTPAPARHKPGQLQAILFDDKVVVTDIDQTVAGGMTGYTMSNGMRQEIVLDRRGRIAQLRVLSRDSSPNPTWWATIIAWFTTGNSINASQYRQVNQYDNADRLIRTDRELAATPGQASNSRRREYGYDRMDRLTNVAGDGESATRFQYDKAGNRLAELSEPTSSGAQYRYVPGSNRLLAITQDEPAPLFGTKSAVAAGGIRSSAALAHSLRSAWLYHPTGVQLSQSHFHGNGIGAHRRTVFNVAKRPVAVYENERLLARYHYNGRGERIAKTVYPAQGDLTKVSQSQKLGDTSYSLYRDQRLAAETDKDGRITTHYIYLYGKPVAKVEMEINLSTSHRLFKAIGLRAKVDRRDRMAKIYAITTDHLGTPQQVMDERREMVWQASTDAFGRTRVPPVGKGATPFLMNLRLPGQVHDAETGLHYNYLRDYDPSTGRYTAPDPLGLSGGINPYAYVSNNPLTNIDPLGLYQIDVHYYMTFFLAITAGVDKDTARKIALAAQYIDDNPATSPTPAGYSIESIRINQPALNRYHFVQKGYDPARTWKDELYLWATESESPSYIINRIQKPASPQLARLLAASNFASTDPNANCDTRAQLFGEYLHTFEDTFAHRNRENAPYDAETFGYGTGHAVDGENPDYTYNHFSGGPGVGLWNNNELRTFVMEKSVYERLKTFTSPKGTQVSFTAISKILTEFNRFQADESEGRKALLGAKIAILSEGLKSLQYEGIDMAYAPDKKSNAYGYNVELAAKNRAESLKKLKSSEYIGTILPDGTAPLPEKTP